MRILFVEDNAINRRVVHEMLRSGGVEMEEAEDGHAGLAMIEAHDYDVILMDLRMPGMDGLTAIEHINRFTDPPNIVVLTTFDADQYVLRALRAGAAGFLLKDTPPAEIVRAIELVAAGDSMLSPAVTRRLIDLVAREPEAGTPHADAARLLAQLSPRELEVARAVGRGLSNADISAELHLSVATVKAHVSRLLEKLGLDNRVQAVVYAYENGLVTPGAG